MLAWFHTSQNMPDHNAIVFLKNNPAQSFKDVELGRLVMDNNGSPSWRIQYSKIIPVNEKPLWAHALDIAAQVPPPGAPNNPEMVIEDLKSRLSFYQDRFRIFLKELSIAGSGNTYPMDFYISAIINRNLSLTEAFIQLIGSKNFLAAAHLARPNLDNLLRLHAAFLTVNPNAFAIQIMKGAKVKSFKDKITQKSLSDAYLRKSVSQEYPWVDKVYTTTSGYIHFGHRHITPNTTVNEYDSSLSFIISPFDYKVSNRERIEALACMLQISLCIGIEIYTYIEAKRAFTS